MVDPRELVLLKGFGVTGAEETEDQRIVTQGYGGAPVSGEPYVEAHTTIRYLTPMTRMKVLDPVETGGR